MATPALSAGAVSAGEAADQRVRRGDVRAQGRSGLAGRPGLTIGMIGCRGVSRQHRVSLGRWKRGGVTFPRMQAT
jgi:hypothetical protein